ncbi:hypothetical protein [Carboxylicivirga linearis]|uniref:Uncharacterized protein n=1 Tax=Carboxylicivirga linearis TaxID=1628157 RepID=A0ABS5K3W1_9BACT|nr:hypothetical protein [Carboxylicivirga linearis]MBS2101021.1 hypothetical protein [Carboxylicivirga linearis]
MKKFSKVLFYFFLVSIFLACTENSLPDISINDISFIQTYENVTLNLPNGVYTPDNPDFDINDPETWTGNMAQYVKHTYMYTVNYCIENTGGSIAYDTEIDFHFRYDNDTKEIKTLYIGDIGPNQKQNSSINHVISNKQLIECRCEVFWFN